MPRTLLCIDIGTSSMKAGLLDDKGHQLAFARAPFVTGAAELADWSANRWRQAFALVCAELRPTSVDAVVISGHGPSVTAVDASGEPLAPSSLWLDHREVRKPGIASYFLPRMRWLLDTYPRLPESGLTWFLGCPEWLAHHLTGEAWSFTPNESFLPYIYDASAADAYAIPTETLPPFLYPGHQAGMVREDIAQECGLPAGIPVFAGGPDYLMSIVGTDAMEPGRICDRAGTSEGINYCSPDPVDDPGLRSLPHILDGHFSVAAILASTGRLFEWYRRISGQAGVDYETMIERTDNRRRWDRRPWFFPSLQEGPISEFSAGMFVGLGADDSAADMGRAVLNSIGFAVKEALDRFAVHGLAVAELRICGGQAKNSAWTRMKADLCGVPLLVPEVADAELVGNCCAGLVGLGEARTLGEAAERAVRFVRRTEPDPEAHARFTDLYGRYRQARERFRAALADCEEL